jgi:hypothetical protein
LRSRYTTLAIFVLAGAVGISAVESVGKAPDRRNDLVI